MPNLFFLLIHTNTVIWYSKTSITWFLKKFQVGGEIYILHIYAIMTHTCRLPYDHLCSCKVSVQHCATFPKAHPIPHTLEKDAGKLNWGMERGSPYTPQRKQLVCYRYHYILFLVFPQPILLPRCPAIRAPVSAPPIWNFISLQLVYYTQNDFFKNLGNQTETANCSQSMPLWPSAHSSTPPISFSCCYSCYLFLFLSLGAQGTWLELHCFPFVALKNATMAALLQSPECQSQQWGGEPIASHTHGVPVLLWQGLTCKSHTAYSPQIARGQGRWKRKCSQYVHLHFIHQIEGTGVYEPLPQR